MIQKLDHTTAAMAQKIRAVFQVSYAVEAQLLNATNFPPLQRTVEDFIGSDTAFYGFMKDQQLAAVVEIATNPTMTHIQSLVVAPAFFRQGMAGKLLDFVFSSYHTPVFMVETGLANEPAKQLYLKYGFEEVAVWDTAHGIRKIRFERRNGQ